MTGVLNEHDRKLLLGCALPLATALAVLVYVYASGGRWSDSAGGGIAYAACVTALLLATWWASSSSSSSSSGWMMQSMAGVTSWAMSSSERFVDSAKTIADDVLMPRLDRLVLGLLGKNADGSTAIQMGGGDEKDDPAIAVTKDRFLHDVGGDAAAAEAIVREYAQIAHLMCRMAESFPDDFQAIFRPIT